MSLHTSALFQELTARGFFYQTINIDVLEERLDQGPITVYVGSDATAPSFHVGHLLVLMLLKWFHRSGHNVIVLLGGGTTQIGDPSDKKGARPILTTDVIQQNLTRLQATIYRLLPPEEKRVHIVNNKEWLEELGYMTFLKEIGRHFSVNRMVNFEFVRNRLDNHLPLSFLELNYMLLQAYDFLQLHDHMDCTLQIGGADQWANILSGVELIRKVRNHEVSAITCPLLTTAAGAKMGKTAQGAIWLDPSLLPPYDFWQFWRNVDDRDVERFLKLFTFLPLDEIRALTAQEGAALNAAKETLADQVTALVHGPECLPSIHQTVHSFFSRAQSALPADKILPLDLDKLKTGFGLLDCLLETGFVASKGEARRLIRAGAIHLKDEVIRDETYVLHAALWADQPMIKLSVGSKKHVWISQKD